LPDCIRTARQMQIARLPRDVELAGKWLAPVEAELLELARRHRRQADDHLRSLALKQASHDQSMPDMFGAPRNGELHDYPVGYCRQIRDRVWESLSDESLAQSLRQKGLTWKKVYFIQDGREFQNAIQCGDRLLDVARDTVDPSREPVESAPLDELTWENFNDWRRFAEVAAIYYRLDVYPNIYFPLLFPLVPFLAVRESGRLELLYCQQMLFFLDLGENWRRIRVVLADRDLMARRLPPEMERRLLDQAGPGAENFPIELRKCSAEELTAAIAEWEQIRKLPDSQAVATLRNFEKLADLTALKLRQADIRMGRD